MAQKRIKEYDKKRSFDKTPEPPGIVSSKKNKKLLFVIQKHDATRLHYDLRLESGGVMISWAVPRGPSLDPENKRLAVHVEDHPLDYRNFEGVIPKGEYGAGPVMIWDEGTYEPQGVDLGKKGIEAGLKKGHVAFLLHGEKLNGEFDLIQTHGQESEGGKNWLLIKREDKFANVGDPRDDFSVRTGRTMYEIQANTKGGDVNSILREAKKSPIPKKVTPMLSTLTDKSFDKDDYIFEVKWDGYRTVAVVEDGNVNLSSRNHRSFNQKFDLIRKALGNVTFNAVFDGEVVAFNAQGKSDFQSLQNWENTKSGTLVFIIFDILYYDRYDLRDLPLLDRKKILSLVLPHNPLFIEGEFIEARGNDFYKAVIESGLEGIIAKNAKSTYQEDVRSRDWLKIKSVKTDEAVICGFTEGRNSRKHFGALVLGQYKNDKLTYIGHTGGGFDEGMLSDVKEKLKPLETGNSPFEVLPKTNAPVTWVKPMIVCSVKFSEWTKEGIMRQPVFLGLREDKNPKEVTGDTEKKQKEIFAHSIPYSNLGKVYFPKKGITKGDVIKYYEQISEIILPYIKDRPLSLLRHPDGVDGKSFYQKDVSGFAPEWITQFKDFLESEDRYVNYMVCNGRDALLYMVNLGCIEINPWFSRVSAPEKPDFLVLDLDPEDIDFDKVVETAQAIHKILDDLDVPSYPKTSGKTGLHIFIPLGGIYSYDESRQFAEMLAYIANSKLPDFTSIDRSPKKRQKKVYIDYLQNRYSQTITAPYSLRPIEEASVSTPLEWSEVNNKLDPKSFTMDKVLKRVKDKGDIFKGALGKGIDMKSILDKLIAKSSLIPGKKGGGRSSRS